MKLHKENLSDNREAILLHSLYNVEDKIVFNKLVEIANIFGSYYFIKIDSIDNQTLQNIQPYLLEPVIREEMNILKVNAFITKHELFNLLTEIDFNKTMIELYIYDKKINSLQSVNKAEYNFYMCVSDNDGPFIIFNKLIYDQDKVLAKIKEIS